MLLAEIWLDSSWRLREMSQRTQIIQQVCLQEIGKGFDFERSSWFWALKKLTCFPLRPQTTAVFIENCGHVPGSFPDVCFINFIVLFLRLDVKCGECLVTSPQYCGQGIPSCHKYHLIFFPFYHTALFPCLDSTCRCCIAKCIEGTEQKVEASSERFVLTISGP